MKDVIQSKISKEKKGRRKKIVNKARMLNKEKKLKRKIQRNSEYGCNGWTNPTRRRQERNKITER